MSRKTDVIVVGSGLAGLMAAYMAGRANLKVRILSEGEGALAIGGGYVDVLGYANGKRVENPFTEIPSLPAEHPYQIAGADNLRASLEELRSCLAAQGMDVAYATDESGNPRNTLVPTIMGTLKPTFLAPARLAPKWPETAQKILVVGVRGFRDCKPSFIISQLKRYPAFKDRDFEPLVIPSPISQGGRSLNSLDLARATEREEGRKWLAAYLEGRGQNHDLALIPPICGRYANRALAGEVEKILGCPFIEMLSVPPAVIGLRIRDAFLRELWKMDAEFFENTRAISAKIEDGKCVSLTAQATGRVIEHYASAFVIATGGILSGGVTLGEGRAKEAIFGLNIPVPENVDYWTRKELLGDHLVTRLGVKVNSAMQALDENGAPILENVRFAGRTLGGYDWTEEKSGLGVACVSGWLAGKQAAEQARGAGK